MVPVGGGLRLGGVGALALFVALLEGLTSEGASREEVLLRAEVPGGTWALALADTDGPCVRLHFEGAFTATCGSWPPVPLHAGSHAGGTADFVFGTAPPETAAVRLELVGGRSITLEMVASTSVVDGRFFAAPVAADPFCGEVVGLNHDGTERARAPIGPTPECEDLFGPR